ncbi:MAG: zinc ribbon domain-containing protein [Clostridia bacterium]|nr:zinc ribbon domain-containing protein [Clostridia bacterium]
MAFLDDIKDKASDAAVVAGKAVNEIYEATRIKMAIAEKKGTVKAIYREIGEAVYASVKNGEDASDVIEDKVAEIDAIFEEIEALRDRQMKIKKLRVCASCGSSVPDDCKFCPKCGSELDASEEESAQEAEIVEEAAEEEAAE